ncbi:Uncharacterised protein [Clostridium sporogenes]|nr:Uncharacterised protein [Clostridium sporogenes]
MRARRLVRLQQSRVGHAFARDHARDERAGRVRCDPLGAIAGRAGHELGRPTRIRAGARPCGGRDGRRGPLHGNASESGRGEVGRPECGAAEPDGRVAGDPRHARPGGEAQSVPGKRFQLKIE